MSSLIKIAVCDLTEEKRCTASVNQKRPERSRPPNRRSRLRLRLVGGERDRERDTDLHNITPRHGLLFNTQRNCLLLQSMVSLLRLLLWQWHYQKNENC